jgi:hypothetical protein
MADLCTAQVSAEGDEPVEPPAPRSDDELLAHLLISTWTVITGRTLRDVPTECLTPEELIDFWADDLCET